MTDPERLRKEAHARLTRLPGLGADARLIEVAAANGEVTLAGEVASVAAKKRALLAVAAIAGVAGIVDRLRVRPAQPMSDAEIRQHVLDALQQEPAFARYRLGLSEADRLDVVRRADEPPAGEAWVAVTDGVVTLNGSLPGLAHKRLAGVLAWWVPGSRDVVNGIEVAPPEPDGDAEITDAVRLALEKDPFVDAGQVQVGTHERVVTLRGQVPSEAEREMAEFDAWYVFAVDDVVNEIRVG